MKLAGAFLVVIWWICLWGLSDILTEHWTREERLVAYSAGALFVVGLTLTYPQLLERL